MADPDPTTGWQGVVAAVIGGMASMKIGDWALSVFQQRRAGNAAEKKQAVDEYKSLVTELREESKRTQKERDECFEQHAISQHKIGELETRVEYMEKTVSRMAGANDGRG